MKVLPDRITRKTYQELEGVSRPTASSRLNDLEESGVLESVPLSSERGRPAKLYLVSRKKYEPTEPRAGEFAEFLKPLVDLASDLGMEYALGPPFSTSAYGRTHYRTPLQFFVEERGKELVSELYNRWENLVELHTLTEEESEKRKRESGLELLSLEDSVVSELAEGKKKGSRSLAPHHAAAALLRNSKAGESLNVDYLCRKAVGENVTTELLDLSEFLEDQFDVSTVPERWKTTLTKFAEAEDGAPQLTYLEGELERFYEVSEKYFESNPWTTFFGVEELGKD